MIKEISQHIRKSLVFPENDSIIFNNASYLINKKNFTPVPTLTQPKTIAFIDGGQAEILSAGNFCLSFIRVYGIVFKENKKIQDSKNEFYLFTRAVWKDDDLFYESRIFPLAEKMIEEYDILISSNDSSIKTGAERAPISKIANIARRFAEISLASTIAADFIVLDGTLEKTFSNEDKYLERLGKNSCALAKSSSLFTTSGNSPVIVLNKIGSEGCWSYNITEKTSFVKLNSKAKHVFRFEGNKDILPFLTENSADALFLGYPYGLVLADQLARVSNTEKKSLQMQFLLKAENKEIAAYLHATNAHDILDSKG